MTEPQQIEVSVWFWNNLHRRGVVSMFRRYRALRHLPMPCTGNRTAWLHSFQCQIRMCLSEKWATAALAITQRHIGLIVEADPEDAGWWHAHAPTGSYSPLGTAAAARAFLELYNDAITRGYFRGVTLPFLWASIKEVLFLLLAAIILTLPISFHAIRHFTHQPVALWELVMVIAVASKCIAVVARMFNRL